MKKFEQDFTKEPLGKQILWFSIPLVCSNLLQVLFNMADIAVVGQFAGSNSLGSVGSTTILVTLFTTLLIGVAGGINVLVAHAIGAKKEREIKETVHTSLIVSLVLGILLLVVGLTLSEPILVALNTKEELLAGAVLYMKIYFLGMPALAIYNFGNAVLSAAGDTRRPLLYLSIAGGINIVLNLFFVIVCRMDVAGVAVASIISQYISAVLVMRVLLKSREAFAVRFSAIRLYPARLAAVLKLGLPAGIQNAIFQVANLFVQRSVNYFSATMVSGNSAAANADGLIYDVMAAFYSACACFIGQNFGAGNKKRILKSYYISLAYSFGISVVMSLVLVLFGRQFLSLFTPDAAVIEAGMQRLMIMGFSYPVSAFMDCTIAASRGLGKSIPPTFIVIMGSCVFRLIWVYTIFEYFKTIPSLYLLYVCSWSLTAVAEIIYFAYAYKKQMKQLEPAAV